MTTALSALHLSKTYRYRGGSTQALDDVTFDIPAGETYGLIGRNGAGKTTFLRIAGTLLMPTSGTVMVLGRDIRTEERAIRTRIAMVPQESRPLYFVSTEELILWYLRMRGMDNLESRRRTNGVIEELGLTDVRSRLVSLLSGGQRRRVMVAMVLASDAEVLFLDEPTTGLDPLARREVWAAISRATRERRTVLLTTHYLDEAEALSAHLALLEGGRLRVEGSPESIRSRVQLPYRVTVDTSWTVEELGSYGSVSPIVNGHLLFTREKEAREVVQAALARGSRVSLAPVSLEDIFLQLVGRPLDEDPPAEKEAA
ncbi:MAG: ABC transporter ATP-binding protein [Thermoplasmata archaeon]|nr:ABC transporter ATP-binding protein [Thermoplasmata archaeon]